MSAPPAGPSDCVAAPAPAGGPAAESPTAPSGPSAPIVAVPTGGGAIRGIGEKFQVTPSSGTGSMTVPITVSPGRSGVGPEPVLSYDSGSGNGPFGLGWSLSLPSITRRTDKGLPRYADHARGEDADVFLLSGAEDLVPVGPDDTTSVPGHDIRRYRPRIEQTFARIERWTRIGDGDVHWRSYSADNVLTILGHDPDARVADPADPKRIFTWNVSAVLDDRGNAVVYRWKREDGAGVAVAAAHERGRGDVDDPGRTANTYPKSIRYGNRVPLLEDGRRPRFPDPAATEAADWCFEVVFDYGEHPAEDPTPHDDRDPARAWPARPDPFSTYRPGFEVRTHRLCRRVLMFHHFDGEPGVGVDRLVRSTDLEYRETPVASFLTSVTARGYRDRDGTTVTRALPPVEFTYSEAEIDPTVRDLDASELERLPVGVDEATYRLLDLDGVGLPGVLAVHDGGWTYAASRGGGRFAPGRPLPAWPTGAHAGTQFVDLAGDGALDLVDWAGPVPGFSERTADGGWTPWRPFGERPNVPFDAADVRFVDLDGNGRADLLRGGGDDVVWHPSLGEDGFGRARRIGLDADERTGPPLPGTGASGQELVTFADLSGDGLPDVVRIRNGEVCYWPSLGFGRFGPRVTMDDAPRFDAQDQFDPSRLRLADVDGSGTTDLVHLGSDGVTVHPNRSGNSWGPARRIDGLPPLDPARSITVTDLLGTGTAYLVWSSSLPADAGRQLRYLDLTGSKPNLLVGVVNNLGARTRIDYAPSTAFYLRDEEAGRPWATRLPFPVHVVERVVTEDRVSRNRFTTRYAYHHGYFDPDDRELRGFAVVDQWDTGSFGALSPHGDPGSEPSAGDDPAGHVAPVRTTSWFHTGVAPGTGRERRPGMVARLLGEPALPDRLSATERREAHRALKGSLLRQEVHAEDALDDDPASATRAGRPYVVTEQSFAVRVLVPRGDERHAVFLPHPAETLVRHLERAEDDPRTQHTLVLEVDDHGTVRKDVAIAQGRRVPDAGLPDDADRRRQGTPLLTYTEREVTVAVGEDGGDDHRTPAPSVARTWELTGYPAAGERHTAADLVDVVDGVPVLRVDGDVEPHASPPPGRRRRLTGEVRVRYRADDLDGLLAVGELEPRALAGETYRLTFVPSMLAAYRRTSDDGTEELVPDRAAVLGGECGYVDLDGDGRWWSPSGRSTLAPDDVAPDVELANARAHFFLPHRFVDPFGHATTVTYDDHDLFAIETADAVGNRTTAGSRAPDGRRDPLVPGYDYRVLAAVRVMDANRNRRSVVFDALGMVVATAVQGTPEEDVGDRIDEQDVAGADLDPDVLAAQLADPTADPHAVLRGAGTRLLYDVEAYLRTRDDAVPQPVVTCTIARETHAPDETDGPSRVRWTFTYSDGSGRDIQRKIVAEPGPVPRRDPAGEIVVDADGEPEWTDTDVAPRWVGTGWRVLNDKGDPVREYEPFFSDTHRFEFGVRVGVSPVLFYDPVGRVAATLHPDGSYDKTVVGPWSLVTHDRNDTVVDDPARDPDVGGLVARYLAALGPGRRTWWERRDGAPGADGEVAAQTVLHAGTPTTAHLDPLGRTVLTVVANRFQDGGGAVDRAEPVWVDLGVEGRPRAVRDRVTRDGAVVDRLVTSYVDDLRGRRMHESDQDAGARWELPDVGGAPVRRWDDRGHAVRTGYDAARRPARVWVRGADPADPDAEVLTERVVHGEQHPQGERHNLRGRPWLRLDQAGAVLTGSHDFAGNLIASARRLAGDPHGDPDWSPVDAVVPDGAVVDPAELDAALDLLVEPEAFTMLARFDALARVVTRTLPDATVLRARYTDAGLLGQLSANLRGESTAVGPVWTPFVTDVDHDAQGRRTRLTHGNGVVSTFTYDRATGRMIGVRTVRDASAFPDDCPHPETAEWPGCGVQDLRYTHDPMGNVTHVEDRAQQTVFFRNRRTGPGGRFRYDARYRLVEATGREHVGQAATPRPHTWDDAGRTGLDHPGDGTAMARYRETYVHDEVGNLLEMRHRGDDPAAAGWTRGYTYAAPSAHDPSVTGNRLTATSVGDAAVVEALLHDAHGNVERMPHLGSGGPEPNLRWDHHDRLRGADLGGGGTVRYAYDSAGHRVRTYRQKAPGRVEERIVLDGWEVFRRYDGGGSLRFERQTVLVQEGTGRVAQVQTRTADPDRTESGPVRLVRYQSGNHLGSTCVELDDTARIVSYEEYSPFGSTTYQAVRADVEAPNRYRFTGRERDDETGLYHVGARYHAPWLGRWISPDPRGPAADPASYAYCSNSPVSRVDPSGEEDQLAVRMSNLRYDIDHWNPQSSSGLLANKSFNLGFLASDENRRRGNTPFSTMPDLRSPISLKAELAKGGVAARTAVAEMLGSRRFSEVTELDALWQKASKGETRSYSASQSRFRSLIAHDPGEDAQTVRDALGHAGVSITAEKGKRIEFELDDGAYRRPSGGSGGGKAAALTAPAVEPGHDGPAPPPAEAPEAPSAPAPVPTRSGSLGGAFLGSAMGRAIGTAAVEFGRQAVPGVQELEALAGGGAITAFRLGLAPIGGALQSVAAGVPVAGAGAFAGAVGGHLGEQVALRAGAGRTGAAATGLAAAVLTGAAVGALAGAPVGLVGAGPGALIGGVAGAVGYLATRYL